MIVTLFVSNHDDEQTKGKEKANIIFVDFFAYLDCSSKYTFDKFYSIINSYIE